MAGINSNGANNLDDRKVECHRKLMVPFVMCRDGHDRTSAVAGEHVVCDPDGDLFSVNRIDGRGAERNSGFFLGEIRPLKVAL